MKNVKIYIKERQLTLCSLLYLYLPIYLFFITWTKWWIAVLIILVSLYCGINFFNHNSNTEYYNDVSVSLFSLIVVSFFILFLGILSGWGGIIAQSADWTKHNAILKDLVTMEWPVYYRDAATPSMLTYYIGQYLIPAAVGKLAGSFVVAEIMMYLWGIIGIFLVIFNLFYILGASSFKRQLIVIFIFMLFNGCIVISQCLYGALTGIFTFDMRWMTGSLLQYRGNFVDLRWVMPQTIAVWIVVTIWWRNRHNVQYYIPLMLPSMLNGAISFLGVAIMAIVCAIYETFLEHCRCRQFFKRALSLPNILTLLALGVPLLLYFSGNVLMEKDPQVELCIQPQVFNFKEFFPIYISFCLGEFGLYSIFIWRRHWKNGVFIGAFFLLIVLPFFKMGAYNDLVMSGSISAMFVLMICVIDVLFNRPRKLPAILLITCLLIGSINPLQEMKMIIYIEREMVYNHENYPRELVQNVMAISPVKDNSNLMSKEITWKYNYYSYNVDNNAFIKYLARVNWKQ